MKPTTRRKFIARAATTLTVPLWPRVGALSFQTRDAARIKARPFELKQVRLRPGPFLHAAEVNRKHTRRRYECRFAFACRTGPVEEEP